MKQRSVCMRLRMSQYCLIYSEEDVRERSGNIGSEEASSQRPVCHPYSRVGFFSYKEYGEGSSGGEWKDQNYVDMEDRGACQRLFL